MAAADSDPMTTPFLERRSPLKVSYALLILFAFFFFLPSAFRAARLSLGQKENDVKDWLPSDFPETAELSWFAKHFIGESFVIATWPKCNGEDQRLKMLEKKLIRESSEYDPTSEMSPAMVKSYEKAKAFGIKHQMFYAGDAMDDWGGEEEKWLSTPNGVWFYITRDGRVYRWEGKANVIAAAKRAYKKYSGESPLKGTLVTAFGDDDGNVNPFYNDPSLFCAPLIHSVQTGESIARELSREGGSLWPIDLTDEKRRPVVAMRRAMSRLTGTLFAPAVPNDFDWSAKAFRAELGEKAAKDLPAEFDFKVAKTVQAIVDEKYDGSIQGLGTATVKQQEDAWYAVFDAAKVEPPPRTTCLLITLTKLGKDNLANILGRGVLGGPRGRLLQLASESGVRPASPPSLAPPPFDTEDPITLAGMPPLRLGGPPVDNVAIDEEGTVTLIRLVGYSVFVGVILSYLCFRSFLITMMVFVVGGSSAVLSMAFVWWTGGHVDAILMSMPSLVYVLGLSGAIHVVNYYRDEVRERGQSGAAGRAIKHALFPCSLAALTTAIGLISLYSSNLAPIRNFGLYAAIGVVATLTILFTYLPASLQAFTPSIFRSDKKNEAKEPEPIPESWLSDAWAAIGKWITRRHAFVTISCLLLLVGGAIGLTKIKTSVQLLKLFDPDSRIIDDYAWVEDNFGKLVPMEVVVRMPANMQEESFGSAKGQDENAADKEPVDPSQRLVALPMLDRVRLVSRVRKVVYRALGETGLDVVVQATSADTFLPPLPYVSNNYTPIHSQFNRKLLEGRDELLESDYLRIEEDGPYEGSELWRVSLRVGALSDVPYGEFIKTLRTTVEPVMRAYDTREKLIRGLLANQDGNGAKVKLSGKDRVVVIGKRKPKSLDEVALLRNIVGGDPTAMATQEDLIDTEAIYLSALHEILGGVSIKTPVWIDPTQPDTPLEVGSEKWDRVISGVDAVVWVGGDGLTREDFASAKTLVDAQSIFNQQATAVVAEGNIPKVVGTDGSLSVVYTGLVPVVYKAQRTLLASLVRSIGMAFVLIALVMIVLLNPGRFPASFFLPSQAGNGFAAGAISMIPNVFPVLFVFGVMGHFGRLIDIGTMMTASVAMGVAVDDTIHFLSWFRSYLDKGFSRVDAVIETYRRVGPAMTQTTIVGGLGLFVFALSTFTPTQRFGTLMLVLLAAALFGDLVLLPALLAGPAGRFFKRREGSEEREKTVDLPSKSDASVALDEPTESTIDDDEQLVASDESAADDSSDTNLTIDKESLPHLKVHFPNTKTEGSRRIKRR